MKFTQILALAASVYIVSFIAMFEVFGPAVRDDSHGWLGPTPRSKHLKGMMDDIGKVNFYTGTDITLYRVYRPLCAVWLWANC
jgi:hypothetical protein